VIRSPQGDSSYNPYQRRDEGGSLTNQQIRAAPASNTNDGDEDSAEICGDSSSVGPKVSDAITYGPRFCELFDAYSKTLSGPIDVSRHLMSLCVDNLIPFCKWARESEMQLSYIRATLLEYDYLRPEVRNGIVMVLIYTFASKRATHDPALELDMFMTLQDAEMGLGIANKFSLKIYNDPFLYLSFLKISISALIDAGAIPENERLNHPRRCKVQSENREELLAFAQLQRMLVGYLDSKDNASARSMMQTIDHYWQQRAKVRAITTDTFVRLGSTNTNNV
jgi:hypothetical protein